MLSRYQEVFLGVELAGRIDRCRRSKMRDARHVLVLEVDICNAADTWYVQGPEAIRVLCGTALPEVLYAWDGVYIVVVPEQSTLVG